MGTKGYRNGSHQRWILSGLLSLVMVLFFDSAQAIMGGEDVDKSDFESLPLVGILHGPSDSNDDLLVCSGVLLNATTVLTAAHCVQDPVVFVVRSSDARRNYPRRRINSNSIFTNPKHNPITKFYDFAIIKLEEAFEEHEQIRYPLLTAAKNASYFRLYGYGLDHWGKDGDLKFTVKYPADVLAYSSDKENQHFIQFNQANKVGICEGDSGGPVFVEDDNKLHLLAIHTFATNFKGKPTCTYSGTSTYIRSDLEWIKSYL